VQYACISFNCFRFLIIYEDFNDYIAASKNFSSFDLRCEDGLRNSSPNMDIDSPEILRGTEISTEAGGGFMEKERATMATGIVIEKEDSKNEDLTPKTLKDSLTPTAYGKSS